MIQSAKLSEVREAVIAMGITFKVVGEEFILEHWDLIAQIPFDTTTADKLRKAHHAATQKDKNRATGEEV